MINKESLSRNIHNMSSAQTQRKPATAANTVGGWMRCIVLLLLAIVCQNISAQRERNYIYILDCSNSMKTDYQIWEPTLQYLHEDIERLSATTMLTIVPFQGHVYSDLLRHELKKDFNWAQFEKGVRPKVDELTGTNICEAWDKALTYVDPNKDNYIYLLTDGKDNKNPSPDGTDNVVKRINQWCEKAKNAHGYFVMLSNEAADERIKAAVNQCPHFSPVDFTKHMVPFGSFDRTTMYYNTIDPHEVTVSFSAEGAFRASVTSEDPLIDVTLKNGGISNGRATFVVSPKGDLTDRPDDFEVQLKVNSDEVEILNPDLTLSVKNIPERNVQLPAEQLDLGEAEWYDSFWWSDAKEPDTLTVDLQPMFNESARKTGSYLKLKLSDTTEGVNGMEADVLLNGNPLTDGIINLKPGEPAVLSLVLHVDAIEGKHYYLLQTVQGGHGNLETINQEPVVDYELTMRSAYDVDINPLKLAVMWIAGILLVLLLVWFLLVRPFVFKRLKIFSLTISDPYYNTLSVNGALRVVCTSVPKKQSAWSRIFVGKVIYEVNEVWQHEWVLEPLDDGAIISASGHYIDPLDSPLEPGTEYKMEDMDDAKNRAVVCIS